jgi:hypothetical protein
MYTCNFFINLCFSDCEELKAIALILQLHIDKVSRTLLKQLKRRDRLSEKRILLNEATTALLRKRSGNDYENIGQNETV